MKTQKRKENLLHQIKNSEQIEQKRNLHLAKVISLSISILGILVMGPLSYKQGNNAMAICSFGYGILAMGVFIYTNIRKDLIGFNIITTIITYFLLFSYLINGGNEGFGLTWILLFPLLYLYMLGDKLFITIISCNVLFIILGFFTPLHKYVYQGWNMAYRIRFTLLLSVESLFAIALKLATSNTDNNRRHILNELLRLQENLQDVVNIRTKELLKEKNRSDKFLIELAMSLAATIDAKDTYTSGHSKRVAEYSREIARRLGKNDAEQQKIYLVALLHDIGKIGIPDEIINKTGKLTDEEYEVVKQHPIIGSNILKNSSRAMIFQNTQKL